MGTVFNVVLPVFAIILCGFLSAHYRLLGPESTEALNRFVYYIALPVMLFHSMASVETTTIFNWPYISAYAAGQMVTFVLALLVARVVFGLRLAEGGLFSMNSIWGNTGYMGIPLAIVAFGPEGGLPAIIATVYQTIVIIGIVAVMIEVDISKRADALGMIGDVCRGLVTNPLIVAPVLGLLFSMSGLTLLEPIDTFARIVSPAAGPCALFALGMFLVGKPLSQGASEVSGMVLIKLIIQPVITWWFVFHVFDMDPTWGAIAVLMAALPMGATGFVMAQKYGIYIQRTSSATLVSTVLAVVSVSVLFLMAFMQP